MHDAKGRALSAEKPAALVIGAGPAGLMAAEVLAGQGVPVVVAEAMPTPARKFLMAGKSGLNLTKDEPREAFQARFSGALPRTPGYFQTDEMGRKAPCLSEPRQGFTCRGHWRPRLYRPITLAGQG